MESTQIASRAADTSDPRAGLRAVASLRLLTEALELRQVEAAGEIDYPAVHVLPSPNAVGALGRADDALALCDGKLPDYP